MAFWRDLYRLFLYSRANPNMGATSVTGIGHGSSMMSKGSPGPQRRMVRILIVEDDQTAYYGEDFRKADYVITEDGVVLKTRDGSDPPVVLRGSKKRKHRSIDES